MRRAPPARQCAQDVHAADGGYFVLPLPHHGINGHPAVFSSRVYSNIYSSGVVVNPDQAKALHARYSKRAQPFGLTLEELDFKNFPARNEYPGIPVRAWLRFPNCAELVDGEVFAWTERAAEVTWKDGPLTYRTWVWASAVTRRGEAMSRNLGERVNRDSNSE